MADLDDDYDLLTYGEAGARLAGEIEATGQALTAAEAAGDDEGAALASHRLEELHVAARRNSPRARDNKAFVEFFGFEPRARTP